MMPDNSNQFIRSTCTICQIGCGMLVHLEDGKVASVEGDPNNPLNRGKLCPKGYASIEYLYSKERLRHPLKRLGNRGEGKWAEISWDEAFDTIASNFKSVREDYGAEAVGFVRGSVKGINFYLIQRFANVFGSPNLASQSHVCFAPRINASNLTYGFYAVPDYENNPHCIVVWGKNMKGTLFHAYDKVLCAVKRGTKLIVIDPRKNDLAERSDVWCMIRPGTDLALALGLMNVIISENIYHKQFVEEYTFGFDALVEHVKQYTPEKVEKITGVPSEQIVSIARIYATSRPSCIQWGNAIDQGINSYQTARAICILRAITGNLCVPGGESQWIMPGKLNFKSLLLFDKISSEKRARKLDSKLELIDPTINEIIPESLLNAILTKKPYPIKSVYVAGANPIITFTNTKKTVEAFKTLEFLVVADMFMTPTAALADIVLPATTFFEWNGIMSPPYSHPIVESYHKLVRIEDCRSDFEIFSEISKRLGHGELFGSDEKKVLDNFLKPFGITFDELTQIGPITGVKQYRQYVRNGFRTPSKKVELYSQELKDKGFDPLPVYKESVTNNSEYPFTLFSWKDEYYRHSEGRQIELLRNIHPEPLVRIHPEAANELDIKEGEWVIIETEIGNIKQKTKIDPDIDRYCVGVDYCWWYPENGYADLFGSYISNINVLTTDEQPYNCEMGSTILRGMLCKISRLEK